MPELFTNAKNAAGCIFGIIFGEKYTLFARKWLYFCTVKMCDGVSPMTGKCLMQDVARCSALSEQGLQDAVTAYLTPAMTGSRALETMLAPP